MDPTAIDWFVQVALDALARGESLSPVALLLLLREHAAGGENTIAEALGPALARGLDMCRSPAESDRRADWLTLFAEASAFSDDDRLGASAAAIAADLMGLWPCQGSPARIMRSIDACLSAMDVIPDRGQARGLLTAAIDELERVVGGAYVPGDGMRSLEGGSGSGTPADHAATASALLTAYAATARLPYSMLAEELVQVMRRRWWDGEQSLFVEAQSSASDRSRTLTLAQGSGLALDQFLLNCAAARTLTRVAALHFDAGYRQAAVVARDADYAGDARRILFSLGSCCRAFDLDGVLYAIALRECLQ